MVLVFKKNKGDINPQLTKLELVNVNPQRSVMLLGDILSAALKSFVSPVKQKDADI